MAFREGVDERLNHQLKTKMKKLLILIILMCSIDLGHSYAQNVTVGAARISSLFAFIGAGTKLVCFPTNQEE